MEPFLGQIMMFAGNFAPQGWAFCNGQLLPISAYSALFSLLGTTYGGDGKTSFALPDLRGRVPLSMGQGAGLSNYPLGALGGAESVTLSTAQMPSHNHLATCQQAEGTTNDPTNSVPAVARDSSADDYGTSPNKTMSPGFIQPAGGNLPHENRQPYLCVNFVIALVGIYPSRS